MYLVSAKEKKFLFLGFGLVIIILILFSLFRVYLRNTSYEILSSWLQTENLNIQQGNLLTAVSGTQGILLSSHLVTGVRLLEYKNNKINSLVEFGETPILKEIPRLKSNNIYFEFSGPFSNRAFYLFKNNPNIILIIDFYPRIISIVFILVSLIFMFVFIYSWNFIYNLEKEEALNREILLTQAIEDLINKRDISDILQKKVPNLVNKWSYLCAKFDELKENEANIIISNRLAELAKQVSHDIRSPLSALMMMTSSLDQVSEEKRLVIRNATQRINDIANQLLQQTKKSQNVELNSNLEQNGIQEKNILLSSLVDTLVSEKRVQYREKSSVSIEADISQSYGLFAEVDSVELKRVLSNLINNSVESLSNNQGLITIAIRDYNQNIAILIADNGKGIPEHVLSKLGNMGVSYGKEGISESGSGLGVFHARKTIESFGGSFKIHSKEKMGTIVTLILPKSKPPKWFIEKITISKNQTIVALDDDVSIHGVWKGRLQNINAESLGISLVSFTSGDDFKTWVNQNVQKLNSVLFLVDYELLNQKQTGLDIIKELSIQAILVTSRSEEPQIITECKQLGIGIIPKSMAGLVPILIETINDI